ncbi:MAG: serine/threonine protein kinase [Acidobacteria bacterium]|nr:serine/threonine protein kinase [Acidobacteriota bacterium]
MTRLHPEGPPSPADRSASVGEEQLLQRRLGLWSGLAFGVGAVFYGVAQVMVAVGLERAWPLSGHAVYGAMLVLVAGMWLYCRRDRRPRASLRTIDVLITLFLAAWNLVMPVGTIPEPEAQVTVMLLAAMFTLYARSIFIPSTALRTFLVSVAAATPVAVYSVMTEAARLSVWKVAWLAAAVTVSTAGSGVIYGLRRDISRARRLGQYTLEEKLGEGGMGVVYRARHALLRRPTAIKLLKPDRVGEASLRRFEREVQLTASLSHPNTVSVYDFGLTSDGVFYYVMEYLDGLTLDQVVAGDGPQTPGRVVHVLRQVLGALAEAHGIGLIHRDIKPGNIIVSERGGLPDVAKVVDFGLVKDLETPDGLSHDGTLIGTPLYLAPEAIRSPGVDHRCDLYSLGGVAYLLLTGQPVFDGATVIEICSHHLHTPPIPPSERLGRPLPRDLEAWVLSCLEKEPARRPPTAAAAGEALERCDVGDGWTPDRARGWWRERGQALRGARAGRSEPSGATLTLPLERAASP